jgi:NADH:ubiquinone oxidoreductase subunit F (NADH-binding)
MDVEMYDATCRGEASKSEIDELLDVTYQVEGHTICALGDCSSLANSKALSGILGMKSKQESSISILLQ